jgi:hypothetical protein
VATYLTVTELGFALDSGDLLAAQHNDWYAETELGPIMLRYREARELMADPRLVQSGEHLLARQGIVAGPVYQWFVPIILHRNGDDHARLRSLMRKAFSPRALDVVRGFIRVTALAYTVLCGGAVDLHYASAWTWPILPTTDLNAMTIAVGLLVAGVITTVWRPRAAAAGQ